MFLPRKEYSFCKKSFSRNRVIQLNKSLLQRNYYSFGESIILLLKLYQRAIGLYSRKLFSETVVTLLTEKNIYTLTEGVVLLAPAISVVDIISKDKACMQFGCFCLLCIKNNKNTISNDYFITTTKLSRNVDSKLDLGVLNHTHPIICFTSF